DRLYSEDADWNMLLSEFSSKATAEHAALVDFLTRSRNLLPGDPDADTPAIARGLLQPGLSAIVYRCEEFRPKRFHKAIDESSTEICAAWIHQDLQTLYFVTRSEPSVRWSRSKELVHRQWDLFVLHYDAMQKLLYVHSSDTSSRHEALAFAVG